MNQAATQRADRALRQWVRGGRTLVDVGEELAYQRQERGLSQDDLAQRATLPLETIRTLESGARLPTREEFQPLAAGLGLTAGQVAEMLRPVLDHQADDIGAFHGCYAAPS